MSDSQFDITDLISGLRATSDIAKRLERKIDDLDAVSDSTREDLRLHGAELVSIKDLVQALNRTLHHSNGRESVMTRLFTLEREVEATRTDVRQLYVEMRQATAEAKRGREALERIDREGRWRLVGIIATGIFTLTAAAIALFG